MFSDFFIKRPIFATVIAILMVLAGLLCMYTLPIAQYPDITPPTVMVMADYPWTRLPSTYRTRCRRFRRNCPRLWWNRGSP